MDGMHDLGGKQGFGPVRHAPGAPVFHEDWEKRVNALYGLAVRLGIFNMDEYRHAIERMEPRHYMAAGYFERTLTSLATLCVEKGVVTLEELERRHIVRVLAVAMGRVEEAARLLGIPRSSLYEKIRRFGLGPQR